MTREIAVSKKSVELFGKISEVGIFRKIGASERYPFHSVCTLNVYSVVFTADLSPQCLCMVLDAVCVEDNLLLDPHLDNLLNVLFGQVRKINIIAVLTDTQISASNRTVRLAPNGTKLGLSTITFQLLSQNVLINDLKKSQFCPIW